MTIYHFDQAMNDHNHSGRTTAGAILEHSDKQDFNIGLDVSGGWGYAFRKPFNAVLVKNAGVPTLMVFNSLEEGEIKHKRIPESMSTRDVHKEVYEMALTMYETWLRKTLAANGFKETD